MGAPRGLQRYGTFLEGASVEVGGESRAGSKAGSKASNSWSASASSSESSGNEVIATQYPYNRIKNVDVSKIKETLQNFEHAVQKRDPSMVFSQITALRQQKNRRTSFSGPLENQFSFNKNVSPRDLQALAMRGRSRDEGDIANHNAKKPKKSSSSTALRVAEKPREEIGAYC